MSDPVEIRQIDEKYEVLKELGSGAMGQVYEARHRGTGRRVAIKLIREESAKAPGVVARFQREARAAGTIDSEHITQVLDSGTDRTTGAPYLVMELLAGEDLGSLLRRLGPLRPDLALRLVAQTLEGLERAHAKGVIHRDIKPPNLFLARRGESSHVLKLCDFGIAKVKGDLTASQDVSLTHTSALLGSPMYMSPEQVKGAKDVDARSDLWSVGVVLYQLLTGAPPHADADTLGLIFLAICSEEPAPLQSMAPWVSAEIAELVTRALTISLDARFQSAREMKEAVLGHLPGGAEITDALLTAMTDDELLVVAALAERRAAAAPPKSRPKLAATLQVSEHEAAVTASKASGDQLAPDSTATGGAFSRTGAAAGGSMGPPAARSRRWAITLAAAGAIAAAAVGWRSSSSPRAASPAPSSGVAAAAASANVTATPAPSAEPVAPVAAASAPSAAAAAPASDAASRDAGPATVPRPSVPRAPGGAAAARPAPSGAAPASNAPPNPSAAPPRPSASPAAPISRDFN